MPATGIPTHPAGITRGPDGAMWLTQPGQFRGAPGNRIGRIAATPTSKRQCRRGGWRTFPAFRNQGQCIAFVQRGR